MSEKELFGPKHYGKNIGALLALLVSKWPLLSDNDLNGVLDALNTSWLHLKEAKAKIELRVNGQSVWTKDFNK